MKTQSLYISVINDHGPPVMHNKVIACIPTTHLLGITNLKLLTASRRDSRRGSTLIESVKADKNVFDEVSYRLLIIGRHRHSMTQAEQWTPRRKLSQIIWILLFILNRSLNISVRWDRNYSVSAVSPVPALQPKMLLFFLSWGQMMWTHSVCSGWISAKVPTKSLSPSLVMDSYIPGL